MTAQVSPALKCAETVAHAFRLTLAAALTTGPETIAHNSPAL